MDDIRINFQTQEGKHKQTTIVPSDFPTGDARKAMQFLLGLPENSLCQLVSWRTRQVLEAHSTFQEAGVQENETLVLVPVDKLQEWLNQTSQQFIPNSLSAPPFKKSPVLHEYQLLLTIPGNSAQNWQYSVHLAERHENDPQSFFTDSNQRERLNFENALKKFLNRELHPSKLDKILRDWWTEIAQGYRSTSLRLEEQ